jgi:hypothetical protein
MSRAVCWRGAALGERGVSVRLRRCSLLAGCGGACAARARVVEEADRRAIPEPTGRLMNELGVFLSIPRRVGPGRAAEAAGAGDRREELWAGPPESCDKPQQPCAIAASHEPAGGGRAADAAGRWRSTRRATEATTPMLRSTSTTLLHCFKPRTGWRRPSR